MREAPGLRRLKGFIGITEVNFFGFSLNFVGSANYAWSLSMAPVTYVILLLRVLSDGAAAVCMSPSFFSLFHDILARKPNNHFGGIHLCGRVGVCPSSARATCEYSQLSRRSVQFSLDGFRFDDPACSPIPMRRNQGQGHSGSRVEARNCSRDG
jgi:hypothetical protein